jgi:hypothetical protein
MKKFQKCTKSHEELPNMHKTPPGSSKGAQNPMRNFQKGTKSHKELPKNAQNPIMNFQKCTNSQEKLPNMHKIP